jgi:hypothetical protein
MFELPSSTVWLILLSFTALFKLFWTRRRSAAERYVARLPIARTDGINPKQAWITDARRVIERALGEHSGPFCITTSTGIKVVVRQALAEEFTRHKSISGVETLRIDGFADFPGQVPILELVPTSAD